MRALIVLSAAALGLSACATGGGESQYHADLRRLQDDCRARGGVLVPSGNTTSGRAQIEHVCRIDTPTRVDTP